MEGAAHVSEINQMSFARSQMLATSMLLIALPGCSLYLLRPVTVKVQDAETKQPIEGATIGADYAVFMDLALPLASLGRRDGFTDSEGKLKLTVDPYHYRFDLKATAPGYLSEALGQPDVQKRLIRRHWLEWKKELVLEMYAGPEASAELLFPRDYRGVVLVRFSPHDKLPQTLGQRHFIYPVSSTGIAEVRESGLFCHTQVDAFHARFEDGKVVPTAIFPIGGGAREAIMDKSKDVGNEVVALRFVGHVWEHHTWVYVVGTKADADAVHVKLWPKDNLDQRAFQHLNGLP
jgi:hypothetical protein